MRELINSFLNLFGKEIRSVDTPMRSFLQGLKHLNSYYKPDVVIDIGVAQGTPELYKIFPSQKYLLVEASPNFKEHIDQILTSLDGVYENVFCGEKAGQEEFILYEDERKSSKFEITKSLNVSKKISVDVVPLDELVERHQIKGDTLIKVDVEGAELEVLKGATQTLKNTTAVILETGVIDKYLGAPNIRDLFDFMYDHDFVLFDILAGALQPKSRNLYQCDLLFVSKSATFR